MKQSKETRLRAKLLKYQGMYLKKCMEVDARKAGLIISLRVVAIVKRVTTKISQFMDDMNKTNIQALCDDSTALARVISEAVKGGCRHCPAEHICLLDNSEFDSDCAMIIRMWLDKSVHDKRKLRRLAHKNHSQNEPINLNTVVYVKLTAYGRDILEWENAKLYQTCKDHGLTYPEHPGLQTDDLGYSSFMLWELMNCFGNYMQAGTDKIVFEGNSIYFGNGAMKHEEKAF